MLHTSKNTRRTLLCCVAFALLCALSRLLSMGFPMLMISSVLYCFLALFWGASIQRRILNDATRRCLTVIVVLMVLLLILRTNKYIIGDERQNITLYSWYGYTVSFTGMALFTFYTALSIGQEYPYTVLRRANWLLLLWVGFSAAALTNNLHGLVYRFAPGEPNPLSNYTHGPLYWIIVGADVVFLLFSFIIVLKNGRAALPRRYTILPVGVLFLFFLYYIAFYINGNVVPDLMFPHLLNPPEALCLTLMAFWEACIQIGLLPSCSDYEALLQISTTGAVVSDIDGRIAAASQKARNNALPSGDAVLDKYIVFHEQQIGGGTIRWTTDISSVHRLNELLDQSIEKLSEERELIRAEIALTEKKNRLETQNRLYDRISYAVRPQINRIKACLNASDAAPFDEAAYRASLSRCCLYGAFVKRRSNLFLLSAESDTLSTDELYFCLRESLEYLRLCGVQTSLFYAAPKEGGAICPAGALIRIYELFEQVLEASMEMAAIIVHLVAAQEVFLRLELQENVGTPAPALPPDPQLDLRRENGAVYVTIHSVSAEGGGST